MNHIGLNAITAKLSPEGIQIARRWYDSELGIRIAEVEASTSNLSEGEISARYVEITQLPKWESSRKQLIQQVVVATRAHKFVTAFNTALTAVISVASLCNDQVANIADVMQEIEQSINEEKLVAFFILGELVAPTAVVFERFSDEELRNYIAFANTDAGAKLHSALVEAVRSGVLQKLPPLRHFMERTAG